MTLKTIILRLFFLGVFPLCSFGQSDFLKHKACYLLLNKQPQSIGRDTLMIIALDSLMLSINSTDRKEVKEFDELYILKLLKKHSASNDWLKGKAIYNLWNAVHGFFNTGQHIKTFQSFALAESQFEKLKDYDHQAYTLIRMGLDVTYTYKNLYDELKYFEKAIILAQKAKNTRLMLIGLNAKAEFYYNNNDFVNALKAYREFDRLNDQKYLGNKLSIGCTLLQLDSLEKALKYLNSTLKKLPNNSQHDKYLHWFTYNEIIQYYLKKKNFIEAKSYLPKLEEFSYDEVHQASFPKYVYEVEKGLGNYKIALEAFEKYQLGLLEEKKKVEQNNIEGVKSQMALHQQNERLQKAELEKLRSENAKQNQLRWFWAVLGIISILSAVYVIYTNRRLRKVNTSLINKNAEITAALLEGQTTERQRLAADLHDNLGSTMSALQWSIEAINPQKLSLQEQEVYRHVQSAIAQAHGQVRLLSHNLLPDELQKQGLWKALHHLIDKLNRNTPLRWVLTLPDPPPRLNAKTEFELYSIVLELTNNILKHAQATEGRVECRMQNGECRMTVSDNGVGMADQRVKGKGMQSVESRVQSLNATLAITSQAGEGTRFEVRVDSRS